MLKSWKELLVKWLNCFGIDLGTIGNIKTTDILSILDANPVEAGKEPFEILLDILKSHYPKYDDLLCNPSHASWSKEHELYLLLSLTLLHATVYNPSPSYCKTASERLTLSEQEVIVTFLQAAMVFGKDLTKEMLQKCIPSVQGEAVISRPSTPSSPVSPSQSMRRKSGIGGTPLSDFLSSPVAREKRHTVAFRDRLSSLENFLEVEHKENENLLLKQKEQETQIIDLGKKLKEKIKEVSSLKEVLQITAESHKDLQIKSAKDCAERQKLRQELISNENYVQQLEKELETLKNSEQCQYQKLISSEEKCNQFEDAYIKTRAQLKELKEKLQSESEKNYELQSVNIQLERDLQQVLSSHASPTKNGPNSPGYKYMISPSTGPGPENMGFILEREMIEKENENVQLKKDIADWENKWRKLMMEINDVEQKSKREQEAASRTQKKLELKIENLQELLHSHTQELSTCKREKDEVNLKLLDSMREKEALAGQLDEISLKKAALASEHSSLINLQHSLEVKVAQLEAKLNVAGERERDLHEISRKRTSELDEMVQERNEMLIKLKTFQKDKEMIELQLSDTIKKLNHVQSMELEKDELEEQVLSLQLNKEELEQRCHESKVVIETLEEKLRTSNEENKNIQLLLRDARSKAINLTQCLQDMTEEKNAIVVVNVDLMKEKVRLEAELQQALQQGNETKELLYREEAERKETTSKLAEALATNEILTSKLSIVSQQESDLDTTVKEIMKQKKAVDSQLSILLKEKEKLLTALQESCSQLAKSKVESDTLKKALSEKEEEFEELAKKIYNLSDIKSSIEGKLAEERNEKAKLQCSLDEVKTKLLLEQSEVSDLKTALEVSQQLCVEKTSAYDDLFKEKADVEDDLCHYVSSLNATTQENSSLKSEICLLKGEREELLLANADLAKLKSNIDVKLTLMESQLSSLQNEREELFTKLKSVLHERDEKCVELNNVENHLANLETELNILRESNSNLLQQLSRESSLVEGILQEKENMQEKVKCLQDENTEKSQQVSFMKEDLLEKQLLCETLKKESKSLSDTVELLSSQNCAMEDDVRKHMSQITILIDEKDCISKELLKAQADKNDTLNLLETVEKEKKNLVEQISMMERKLEENQQLLLQHEDLMKQAELEKEALRLQIQESHEQQMELHQKANRERENAIQNLQAHQEILYKEIGSEKEALRLQNEVLQTQYADLLKEAEVEKKSLESQNQDLQALQMDVLKQAEVEKVAHKKQIEDLQGQHEGFLEQAAREKESLKFQIQELDAQLEKMKPAEREKEVLSHRVNELQAHYEDLLKQMDAEKETLKQKIFEIRVQHEDHLEQVKKEKEVMKQEILESQNLVGSGNEVEALRKQLEERDKIIAEKDALLSSLVTKHSGDFTEEMSSKNFKVLEEDLRMSQTKSSRLEEELRQLQKMFEEEKAKSWKALEEIRLNDKTNQPSSEKQQHVKGKLAELQHEEIQWQLERVTNQLEFRFDTIMRQKSDLEDHLSQLRIILEDVTHVCDNIFATLPSNCNAVHEITIMKKEVESKLRAVDKKYADCLCGIIILAHEILKCPKAQEDLTISENDSSMELILSSRDKIENKVSMLGEVMTSLNCDVRSVINSCKFLSERCEGYLKAQTRESLKIKASFSKESMEGTSSRNSSQSSQTNRKGSLSTELEGNSESLDSKSEFIAEVESGHTEQDKVDWFGGATSLEEAYNLLKSSYCNLEKQIVDLQDQLKEPKNEVAHLHEKIKTLMEQPTKEEVEEQMKELHVHYAKKFEGMKAKMKKIAQDEIEQVQEEKAKFEKEIVAKFNKRINDFEEHVKQLSAQLWELGEKLLQEEQDHKVTKERLDAVKERQRQYVMSKQHLHSQSLDRLDLLFQGVERNMPRQSQRHCLSQSQGILSSKMRNRSDTSSDIGDCASRQSTMMAPASMGLAFPEEDEDGEVFNNDFLAELKEGRCRAPLDGSRLSELQYRNSLCPPHLKSSYPLEIQFVDPTMCKDEELKGHDIRAKRQGKDHGSTSYKRPGPPTPSRKAGRLSLQGNEDLTPRVALRDHNESQATQGTGTLGVSKTTPSRLRALFKSSKVANAATLPSNKRDENSTPATPTSKRLSIFKRRFGGNKENQNASSGYNSFR